MGTFEGSTRCQKKQTLRIQKREKRAGKRAKRKELMRLARNVCWRMFADGHVRGAGRLLLRILIMSLPEALAVKTAKTIFGPSAAAATPPGTRVGSDSLWKPAPLAVVGSKPTDAKTSSKG